MGKYQGDPVFQDSFDGQWYFWDEVWADKHGPYPNEDHARGMLCMYCDFLDKQSNKPEPTTTLERCIVWGVAVLIVALSWIVAIAGYRYFTS